MGFPFRNIRLTAALVSAVLFGNAVLHADPVLLPNPFNLLNQAPLFGDCFGCRPEKQKCGVDLTAQSVNDVLGNATGGASTGTTCSGLLNLALAADLKQLVGWEGASFKNTWIWLYGRDLSGQVVGNALTVSGVAGVPAFRCYELWFQQNFFTDVVSLRAGMLGLDTEFMTTDAGTLFLNTTFGMASLLTLDFPNAGPTYPAGTPGLRLALQPVSWLTFRSAFAQANPFAQSSSAHGFDWNFGPDGGLLSLNEAAATWNKEADSKRLGGTAKAGFWIQNGASAAPSPGYAFASSSLPGYLSGFYGSLEQQLYNVRENLSSPGKNPKQAVAGGVATKGIAGFTRVGFSPQLGTSCSLYADAGLVYTGLLPTRDQDKLGVAFAYAQVGSGLVDQATAQGLPGAGFESVAELTYSIRLAPAITLQPDLQYVLHPGGTQRYGNALVMGVRAVVNF